MRVQLYSVPSDFGRGANDGAYYPVGLLTLASALQRWKPECKVEILDLHHTSPDIHSGDVVGISASSTLSYRNALALAKVAKEKEATVVLGGPHATRLADQVLRNRAGLVDYIVRGKGEMAFLSLLNAIESGGDLSSVSDLSWRCGDKIIHNGAGNCAWHYDEFLPLDFGAIRGGLSPYWKTCRARLDPTVDAAFLVFTHFGCGYRESQLGRQGSPEGSWCAYCSLSDPVSRRAGSAITAEVLGLVHGTGLPLGADVLLKCYGDNVGTQLPMLRDLRSSIERCEAWADYRFHWTFYSQSSRLSRQLAECLHAVGARNVYIGFDSVDDEIQRLNGLGTSVAAHRRAVQNCVDVDLRIQAGFVLGCAGDNIKSLDSTLRFAEYLADKAILDRINSAVLFIVPGAPAYNLLCTEEPWIRSLDLLPTEEMQWLWVKHFCPQLGRSPSDGLEILRRYASRLDELSPGAHASMGFVSDRLAREAHSLA